jgi:ABC-type phosphate transport system permease subunit
MSTPCFFCKPWQPQKFNPQQTRQEQQYGRPSSILGTVAVSIAASLLTSLCISVCRKLASGSYEQNKKRSFTKIKTANPDPFPRSPLANGGSCFYQKAN